MNSSGRTRVLLPESTMDAVRQCRDLKNAEPPLQGHESERDWNIQDVICVAVANWRDELIRRKREAEQRTRETGQTTAG